MRRRTTRALAALGLAAAGAVAPASACEAPTIPKASLNALRQTLGRASFQLDPSMVIARLTFAAPDAPPSVETIYSGGDARFTEGVIAESKLLRAPCATASAPVKSVEMHRVGVIRTVFRRPYRAPEPRLKHELQMVELVRLIRDLKTHSVRFDLGEMACPFQVQFSPYQPYLPNVVREVTQPDPSRAPFLDWLRNVTLDIPRDMMVTAIGRPSLVTVPCVVLDLS